MPRQPDSALLRETMILFEVSQRRLLLGLGSLTPNRLLIVLMRKGALTPTDLVRITGLEKSWISRAVDGLVEEGFVQKAPSATDRRSVRLTLTDAGLAQAQRVDAALEDNSRSLLAALDTEQRRALIAALAPLRDVLKDRAP
ncbi:MarR family winged helix-turn-helix transcriptional regulator [Uliginosibacterium sp. H1]|uniref:MarR family winged helix-turn-helix transcriptional regulator n=1 Tax=Uliginosibacterium sp. H1 TaxID=3114757 RepID=UPI002E19D271|nr:MarR family transcriptional regulator [Uliginosibacterium sp. H1]